MSVLAVALLCALSSSAAELGDAWAGDEAGEEIGDPIHGLRGHALPSVIQLDDVALGLEVVGFEGTRGAADIPVQVVATGEVSHPLETTITAVSFAFTLLPAEALDRVHHRLTAPPLQLTQAELDERLPSPVAAISDGDVVVEQVEPGTGADVDARYDLGMATLDLDALPGYLLVVDRYELEFPTADDVVTILEHGGTADFAALADWAARQSDERDVFTEDERARIMQTVRAGFRRMRAPPGLGDLQRLLALDLLVQTMAGPADLVPLLELERSIKILHAAALLAYDGALREEAILAAPVHGMDRLPARSEFLVAPDVAMGALRPVVLDRLLRLAFDPVDFHDAPPGAASSRSRLQRQAAALLSPLNTTDVRSNLEAAANERVQQDVLRFYLDVRHAPAMDPLSEWLLAHPDAYEELGKDALQRMPDALLPEVMRRYIEPADPEHRPLLRTYAEAMPARLGPQLLEILRGVGLDVAPFTRDSGDVDVSAALDAFEAVEQKLARRRSAELVAELESNGTDPITLRESHRLIERLAQLDPAAIEANADFVIEVLSVSAEQFRDSPLDRERALSRLEKLPFGARETDAKRVAEMTRARLEYGDGDGSAALARLEALDPELAQAEVRALWVELMHDVFAQHLRDGLFDAATRLLDAAESLAPQEVDVPELRRRLQWRRHRTAMIVGAAFGLVFLCSIALLVGRAIKAGLTRWRKAKREMDLLIRRQEDADASAEDAVDLEGDEPRQDADAPAADAPEPEDAPPEEETPLEDCALSWEGRDPFGDCFERDGLTDVFDAWSDDAVEEPVSGAKLVS